MKFKRHHFRYPSQIVSIKKSGFRSGVASSETAHASSVQLILVLLGSAEPNSATQDKIIIPGQRPYCQWEGGQYDRKPSQQTSHFRNSMTMTPRKLRMHVVPESIYSHQVQNRD